jgi:hypothetical protein
MEGCEQKITFWFAIALNILAQIVMSKQWHLLWFDYMYKGRT